MGLIKLGWMYLGQIVPGQTFFRIKCRLGRSHLGRIKPGQRILGCEMVMSRTILARLKLVLDRHKSSSFKWVCANQVRFRWTWVGFGRVQMDLGQLKSDSCVVGMIQLYV